VPSKYPITSPTDTLKRGVLEGNRVILAQAITLIESKKAADREKAAELLDELLPFSGKSIRIGITGVPGVGKSTFIEQFGLYLIDQEKKVAVLSVDPSSALSKGSILGDKTRMNELARNPRAFIRPSPSQNALGGVTTTTRETILLCEAAGYDCVLIETVGVGQSEVAVRELVDAFLLLMLAGSGDELQGIKRGIMEMADLILINKADGDNLKAARKAKNELELALMLLPPHPDGWKVPCLTVSALNRRDMPQIWDKLSDFLNHTQKSGYFTSQRKNQAGKWLDDLILQRLKTDFYSNPEVSTLIAQLKSALESGEISARKALQRLFR
jgi:LAO/AO transport system kinase